MAASHRKACCAGQAGARTGDFAVTLRALLASCSAMRLAATVLTVGSLLPSSYDLLCENIVSHAKAAARLHNAGKAAAAEMEAVAAVEAYRSAVKLEPSEPQAYLHAGQAMYNMQRFDEAIAAFTSAGEGTPPHTSAPPHFCTSAPPHSPHHETSALHRRAPSYRREHPCRPALA